MAIKVLCLLALLSCIHGFKLSKEFKILEEELKSMVSDYKKATNRNNVRKANDEEVETKDVADAIIDVNLKTDKINMLDGGDMILNVEQKHQNNLPDGVQANLIRTTANHWNKSIDSAGKYYVDVPFIYDAAVPVEVRSAFQLAIEDFTSKTCIRFIPRVKNESNYINVINDRGCYSYVGRQSSTMFPNGQPISLQYPGCHFKGIAIHEMMHALGYFHEQSRSDRDTYVKVNTENIIDGMQGNFDKSNTDNQGTEYDYNSIMHYGSMAFSKNGLQTLIRLKGAGQLGQSEGFSQIDIESINKLYCGATEPTCHSLPDDICEDLRGRGYCKVCSVRQQCKTKCVDVNENCALFGSSYCDNPHYSTWFFANCAATCNKCPE